MFGKSAEDKAKDLPSSPRAALSLAPSAKAQVVQIIRQKEPENLEFPFPALANVALPLRLAGVERREAAGRAEAALAKVGLDAAAGLKPEAMEIIFEGAAEGKPDEPPKPSGSIHYSRAIPRTKIDDTLLAYHMNGEPLPESHGAPVRAVVGGWYGMASVKWLSRIVVSDRPFLGYFQSVDYAFWDEQSGMPIHVPLSEMKVKSQIARPALHEVIPANSEYRIVGAAWTGDNTDVTTVEVSTDGGKSYSAATLLGEPIRHAWRFWEFDWNTSAAGNYKLMSRATDALGNQQPTERESKYGSYVIYHTLAVDVEVR